MGRPDSAPPIVVRYSDEALDWGIATLPKVILRYYRYLRCDGESLDDREMMPLLLMLGLWEDREAPLRLSNLPSATPITTIEKRYLRKWRQMGLVFTRRVYYSRKEMIEVFGAENAPVTPRLKARLFDVSSLLHNCLRAARLWEEECYPAAYQAWQKKCEADGALGRRAAQPPHSRYPSGKFADEFTVEIVLPPELAVELADKEDCRYQFVAEKWHRRATEVAESVSAQRVPVRDGTGTDRAGTGPRTGTNRSGHQYNTSFQEVTLSADAEGGPRDASPTARQAPPRSPTDAVQGSPRRLPDGGSGRGPAGPARVPSRGEQGSVAGSSGSRVEPLPERRRRVLTDLRRFDGDRRTQIAIVTKNVAAILGLGVNAAGGLRTRPQKADYGRIGALIKNYGGPQVVWKAACRAAAQPIDGNPLDYLQACLRDQRESNRPRRRTSAPQARSEAQNDYPQSAEGYGEDWEV